jgi:hypothetical protein
MRQEFSDPSTRPPPTSGAPTSVGIFNAHFRLMRMLTKEYSVTLFGMLLFEHLYTYRTWKTFFHFAHARQNKFGKTLTTN